MFKVVFFYKEIDDVVCHIITTQGVNNVIQIYHHQGWLQTKKNLLIIHYLFATTFVHNLFPFFNDFGSQTHLQLIIPKLK
jgi:hypothetical protein